jgi:hypothetical protein
MVAPAKRVMFVVQIFLLFGLCTYASQMSKSQSMGYGLPHLGLYRIHGHAPSGFESFYEFEMGLLLGQSVEADEKGNLPIDGALFIKPTEFHSGTKTEERGEMSNSGRVSFIKTVKLKFVSAALQLEGTRFAKIAFVTEAIDGISYSFDGKFLPEAILEKGAYVELTGTLKKFKSGRQEAEANLKFLRWANE